MIADGNSTSAIIVVVRNVAGDVLAGVPVALSASGTGYAMHPASGVTDANGEFASAMDSTVAQNKVRHGRFNRWQAGGHAIGLLQARREY